MAMMGMDRLPPCEIADVVRGGAVKGGAGHNPAGCLHP
jgi:hypothetical protein